MGERRGCNQCVPCAGSLGRWHFVSPVRFTLSFFAVVLLVTACSRHEDSADDKIRKKLPGTWVLEARYETGSDVRNIISYAVGVVLLIVAGFGIYNILNMMIYEKLDAIAILKATGFSGSDVRRIFLLLSMVIGLVGGISGLLFGFLMQNLVDSIPFITAALPTVTTFPVDYNPKYYIIAVTFALLTTWIAGWFPARKASQVDPVEIIRGK